MKTEPFTQSIQSQLIPTSHSSPIPGTASPQNLSKKIAALFQNLGTLALLAIVFPFTLTVVLLSLIWSWISRPFQKAPVIAASPKTVMIAGARMTKTLQLARSFQAAGHRAIIIDLDRFWLSGNRFSNAIAGFYTVPDPAKGWETYCEALRSIVEKEKVDLFIPVAMFAVTYPDGVTQHPLNGFCEVCHFEAETVRMLDDKFAFVERARSLGLSMPKSFKITSPDQVLNFDFSQEKNPYILKSIHYDAVRRLDMTKLPCATPEETAAFVNRLPMSEDQPWIMQEFIRGQEYCTHSTVRNGKSTLYCCCPSSAFQVNYEHVDNPQISDWITRFLADLDGYGQASFDVIQTEDGTVYPIECNPRTHTAVTTFYNHLGVADAYLNPEPPTEPLLPLSTAKPTYWLYHELWRLNEVRSIKQLQTWFHNVTRGTDALFRVHDPLPFLMVHHWQIPLLILQNLRQLRGWVRIDFNIGELIEQFDH